MKTLKYLFLLIVVSVFSACVTDEVIPVDASFSLSFAKEGKTYASVASGFYVVKEGTGEFWTVYDGTAGHVWGEAGATGTFFDQNDSVKIIYSTPGTYKLTVVATSSVNFGSETITDVQSQDVVVKDERNEFSYFYIADAAGAVLYNGSIYDDSIVVKIPDIVTSSEFVPTFVLNSDSAKAYVNGVRQFSGTTSNDFSTTVVYSVVSSVGSAKNYNVIFRKFAASDAKNLTKFNLAVYNADAAYYNSNGEAGVIDNTANVINLSVNYGTLKNKSKLVLESSDLSSIYVDGVLYSKTKLYNLNNISIVKVVAQNKTEKSYTLSMTDQDPVQSFTFAGLVPAPVGVVDKVAKTITVSVLEGTDITSLVASWVGTVGKVTVNSVVQTNGSTVNDFTSPVTYTFYKGTTVGDVYTVNVIVK